MFSKTDIEIMSLPYFDVIGANNEAFELRSKNTGHFWKIFPEGVGYRLMHKYHLEDPYHYQIYMDSVLDLILEVINHDDYILHGSRLKRAYKTKEGEYFNEVVRKYSLRSIAS